MQELAAMYPDQKPLSTAAESRRAMFDKVLGSNRLRTLFIGAGRRVTPAMVQFWQPSAKFMARRARHLLY